MAVNRRVHLMILLTVVAGCGRSAPVAPVASFEAHRYVSSLAFSPSGSMLATSGGGLDRGQTTYFQGVKVWDAASRITLRHIPISDQVKAIAFSPDGKTLAIGDGDFGGSGNVYLFDALTGERLKSLDGRTGWGYGLAFSPDGMLLVTCRGSKVEVWDVAGWRKRSSHDWLGGNYRSVSFAPDSRTYVTGGGTPILPILDTGTISLWDTATGTPIWSRTGHSQVVECVAFAPGGEIIASGGMDGVLKLWDSTNGRESFTASLDGPSGRVLAVAFSPDGKYLAVALGNHSRGGMWGELRVLKVGAKLMRLIPIFKLSYPFTCVAFSPDGRFLVAGDVSGTIRVWETAKVLEKVPRN